VGALQRLAFHHIPKLMEMALATVGALEQRPTLEKFLQVLA
jgi:hypothetical protein